MYEEKLIEIFTKYQQEHLISDILALSVAEQVQLLDQLEKTLPNEHTTKPFVISSYEILSEKNHAIAKSSADFKDKHLGVIVMAAGQGIRLGIDIPKGMIEITPIKNKTLFQLLCEKVKASERYYQCRITLFIMLSEENSNQVKAFFIKQKLFGLHSSQVKFFTQPNALMADEWGKWVWQSKGILLAGPNGNGALFKSFEMANYTSFCEENKIDHLFVLPIDNPLAPPIDEELFSLHEEKQSDMTLAAIKQDDETKNMGGFVTVDRQIRVVEYFESEDLFELLNIGYYLFSLTFIKQMAQVKLPYHIAKKRGYLKKEQFIFDGLAFTEKTVVVIKKKEDFFAPIKDAILPVQTKLIKRDKEIFSRLFKTQMPVDDIELSMEMHFPTQEVIKKCEKIKNLSIKYIDEDLVSQWEI